MSDQPGPVRSYQRIFSPDRRIYQIEGQALPVPGGVPLRWLGYAVATLLAVIVISARSPGLTALAAVVAALAGLAAGGRPAAILAAGGAVAAMTVLGVVLGSLDWPLRLLVVPGLAATLATQATPDGRPAHRFVASWLGVRVRGRRSLGRPLRTSRTRWLVLAYAWVAPDQHVAQLRRGRVHGPAAVRFTVPMLIRARRWPGRGQLARPVARCGRGSRDVVVDSVDLASGERLELRP